MPNQLPYRDTVTLGARGFFSVVCGEIERRSRDRGVASEKKKTLWLR